MDSTGDEPDSLPGDGVCVTAAGTCTLRAAIEEANTTPGLEGWDGIGFAIPGPGPHTIRPLSPLPDITATVAIGGSTQPGAKESTTIGANDGIFLIELSGEDAGDANGLHFIADDCFVSGLVINRWSGAGLVIDGNSTGVWENFIGTDTTGTVPAPNATGVVIGGRNAVVGNVISGNTGAGIALLGTGSYVWSNTIGLNASGTAALGNSVGVVVRGTQNQIGRPANIIAGNSGPGILLYSGASETSIFGNHIGTNAYGSPAFGNAGDGIVVMGASGVLIGDDTFFSGNDIMANGGHGIALIDAQGTLVRGNRSTGNGGSGVWIEGGPNRIGDSLWNKQNVVAFNDGDGISISGWTSVGNDLEGNSIYSNGRLGIDLGADGYSLNDFEDRDSGPNESQNHPTVLSATLVGTEIRVEGELRSKPSSAYRIDVFGNAICDPWGAGEGEWWLAVADVVTDGTGFATFTASGTTSLPDSASLPISAIAATARDAEGNTSEFSPCAIPTAASTTTTNPTVSSTTTMPGSTTTTTVPDSGGCVWAGDTCPWLSCAVASLTERTDRLRCGGTRIDASIHRLARRIQHLCESEHPAPRRIGLFAGRILRRSLAVEKLEGRCAFQTPH